jgi:multidrug efflux pump subunit AcrA (membrane-fusion protein)
VAKVKVNQKVTLTFDAIEDLNITGEVAEIDALGTVTQGVVNYGVKIIFDTQDERVKSGMSVSAAIITDIKQDVLLVPNAAVKSNNGQYVEVLENNIPRNQTVETGLSNDTMTEITSGLKEGDKVITQTITANTTQTQTQSSTGVRIPGVGGFGR